MKKYCGTALFLMGGLFVSGCAKVSVRTTLDRAEEQTLVRWEPVEGVEPALQYDKMESLKSGSLDVLVLRQEKPVYAVKDAQVTLETTTRKFMKGPAMGVDLPYPICMVTIPVAVVTYSVMAVVGFPDKCYEPRGCCERIQVAMAAGEAQGKPADYRWSPAPGVLVRCTLRNGDSLSARSDASGVARFDLLALARAPLALEKGLSMDLRLKRKGPFMKHLTIAPEEVAVLMSPKN